MARRTKALILAPFAEEYLDRLRAVADVTYEPWIETQRFHGPDQLSPRLREERTGFVVVEADMLRDDVFAVPSLRAAGVTRNGLDLIDVEAATRRGVPVIHTPTRNTIAVAELAIGLMIALARHLAAAHQYVAEGRWTSPIEAYAGFRGREIAGSVVGVVGLGRIGAEVAQRARCLGARVVAADPLVSKSRAQTLGVRLLSLAQLLRRADFVTLHVPQSKTTDKMIDGAMLDLMQPAAYLVSTGGGGTVDLDALAERLRDGRIAGAAIDVFPGHFIAPESPLKALDNVILTPHIGGATEETVVRHSRMIVEDIERLLRGDRPRRVANPKALAVARRGR